MPPRTGAAEARLLAESAARTDCATGKRPDSPAGCPPCTSRSRPLLRGVDVSATAYQLAHIADTQRVVEDPDPAAQNLVEGVHSVDKVSSCSDGHGGRAAWRSTFDVWAPARRLTGPSGNPHYRAPFGTRSHAMSVRTGTPVENRTIDSGSLRHIAQKVALSLAGDRRTTPRPDHSPRSSSAAPP